MIVIRGLNLLTRSILTKDLFVIYKCPKCSVLYRSMTWTSPSLGPRKGLFGWDFRGKQELARQRGRGKNILPRRNGLCKGPEAI